jgi:hypothetical protein
LRLERPRPPLTKGKIAAERERERERERENSGDVQRVICEHPCTE